MLHHWLPTRIYGKLERSVVQTGCHLVQKAIGNTSNAGRRMFLRRLVVAGMLSTPWMALANEHNRNNGTGNGNAKNNSNQRMEKAAKQVRDKHGGRVLSAEPVRDAGGKESIRVKVLTGDGRVKVFHVDP